jgi:O-acetyl-ADP-ribose deacetylase
MTHITAEQGDITQVRADVIVNAANSSLLGGGGVDGAIHRAGGPSILEECRAIRARQGGCPTGEAVITGAGNLPARWVVHTVGPVWQGGHEGEAVLLRTCYLNSLALAVEHGAKTVAFPNISTGIFGYPKAAACAVAVEAVQEFCRESDALESVRFVCFDPENLALYRDALEAV